MFLHRLLANDVCGLAVGRGARNLLLSSKGKILFDGSRLQESAGIVGIASKSLIGDL